MEIGAVRNEKVFVLRLECRARWFEDVPSNFVQIEIAREEIVGIAGAVGAKRPKGGRTGPFLPGPALGPPSGGNQHRVAELVRQVAARGQLGIGA